MTLNKNEFLRKNPKILNNTPGKYIYCNRTITSNVPFHVNFEIFINCDFN